MKRRSILGTIGVAVVPQAGQAALYGAPASVTGPTAGALEPLRLPLAGAQIPARTLADIGSYQRLWRTVFADAETRADFRRDPGSYLRRHSLPDTTLLTNDAEVRLMQALSDDEILASSMGGDYKAFVSRLAELGLVQRAAPSNLKRRIAEAMRQHLPEIQSQARALAAGETSSEDAHLRELLESRELRYLYTQLTPSIEQVAVAAVPVAIAAIVVTYVSVAVGVTVAITAGVYISIAVAVAVVASGGHGRLQLDTLLASADGAQVPQSTRRSARQRAIDHAMATRILIGKRLLALDPERLRQAQVISRTARLLNQDAFVLEANRQLVRDEIGAFVEAAEEADLIRIPAQSRDLVVRAMERLALRAAALE